MSMTDPVADLFIRLLNAGRRAHATVGIPASKLKANILSVLQTEGFIQGFAGQIYSSPRRLFYGRS